MDDQPMKGRGGRPATASEDDERAPWWAWGSFALGLLALGGAYTFLRTSHHLEWHAYIGTSLEPIASFLSLFALVGALWSVHVQRRDLALQRQELRENREEMVEQRKQFERTAKAQEDLAASQARLAKAQEQANLQTLYVELAQRRANLASFLGVLANASIAAATTSAAGDSSFLWGRELLGGTQPANAAEEQLAAEKARIAELERILGLSQPDEPGGAPGQQSDVADGRSGDG